MATFFSFLLELMRARHGTFHGETKNVHRRKAGPGRMPPHRHQHKPPGRKVAKRYGQLISKEVN